MSPKKMVDDYGSSDRLECFQCGASIRRSNMSRHVASHGDPVRQRSSSTSSLVGRTISLQSSEVVVHSRSSSRDSASSRAMTDLVETAGTNFRRDELTTERSISANGPYGGLSLADYLVVGVAAVAATEQHNIFDINRLCDFIARNYPQIPAAARPYLVIGAASGAQHAAHIHFFAESHSNSDDPNRRNLAQGASCSLSSWSLGLRTHSAFHESAPSTQPTTNLQEQSHESRRSQYDRSGPLVERQVERTQSELSACLPNVSVTQAVPVGTAEIQVQCLSEPSTPGEIIVHSPDVSFLDDVHLPVAREESNRACQQLWLQVAENVGIGEAQAVTEALENEQLVDTPVSSTDTTTNLPVLTVAITKHDRSVAECQVRADVASKVSSPPASMTTAASGAVTSNLADTSPTVAVAAKANPEPIPQPGPITTVNRSSPRKSQTVAGLNNEQEAVLIKSTQPQPPPVIEMLPAMEMEFDPQVDTASAGAKRPSTSTHRQDSGKEKERRNSPKRRHEDETSPRRNGNRRDNQGSSPTRFRIPLLVPEDKRHGRRRSRSPLRPSSRRPVYMTDDEQKEFEKFKTQRKSRDKN